MNARKFLKISEFYPAYLRNFYDKSQISTELSYSLHQAELFKDAFGWSNHYAVNLRALGWEAEEIIANDELLQSKWLSENGLVYSGKKATILEQVKAFQPNVVFFEDCSFADVELIEAIRSLHHVPELVLGYYCAPQTQEGLKTLRLYDAVLSCHEGFIDTLNNLGITSHLLRHAFEARLIDRYKLSSLEKNRSITFIGSLMLGKNFHDERLKIIQDVLKSGVDLEIFGNLIDERANYNPLKLFFKKRIPQDLRRIAKPPVFGQQMFKQLAQSLVSLNSHIDFSGPYAANMRLFEATGAGSCLLTDHKKNMGEFFEADFEAVTYRSSQECAEKARWLLDHPEKAKEIGLRGQKRTLRDHTYARRAEELQEFMLKRLK